ncbi:phage holin [Bacillus sp. V59.32b]|uniref:phage holin n=1 Tax=Bacillus sp. V59.32b TaxID=1758642 RepID=UPI000E3BF4D6|nr:PTS mannose transporter subunit IID [Bacillus sp. V59.32b]
MKGDILILLCGFLSSLLLFLGSIGITFEWFESLNAFIILISAALALILNLYAVYKNTYVLTKKARKQKESLKKQGLIKK